MKLLRIQSYVCDEFAFPLYIEFHGRIGRFLQQIWGRSTFYVHDIEEQLETIKLVALIVAEGTK